MRHVHTEALLLGGSAGSAQLCWHRCLSSAAPSNSYVANSNPLCSWRADSTVALGKLPFVGMVLRDGGWASESRACNLLTKGSRTYKPHAH